MREAEQFLLNIDSFKSEAQKVLRHMQQSDMSSQIRVEIMNGPTSKVDCKLLSGLILQYAEECRDRLANIPEDNQIKQLLVLTDLTEAAQLDDFFNKNLSDLNVRMND